MTRMTSWIRSLCAIGIALAFAALACALAAHAGAAPQAESAPAATSDAATGAGARFEIDVAHSTLIYRMRHFGVSWFYGRVNRPSGSFRIDDADLGASFIDVTVEIERMDAGDESRDRFLKSPDFFNVREYPTARFRSSSVKKLGDGEYEAAGDFTMRGVTLPVTVRIDGYTTKATERFGFRGGFEGTFTIARSAYGMDLFVADGTLGDEVRITAAIEGVQR